MDMDALAQSPAPFAVFCPKGALALSESGFAMAFDPKAAPGLLQRLARFDATEWRENIENDFKRELAGFDPALTANPEPLLDALGPEQAKAFLSLLDPETFAASGCNFAFYNFLHSPDPFRRKARLQALQALPALAYEFAKGDSQTDRIRRRIDAGKSLWDAVLEIHPGSAAALRRIAAAGPDAQAWREDLPNLLSVLELMPPEKIPSGPEEWGAMRGAWIGLGIGRERSAWKAQAKTAWFRSFAYAGWTRSFEEVQSAEGGFNALADCFDFIEEAADALLRFYPPAQSLSWNALCELSERAKAHIAQSLSPRKMLAASLRWHAETYRRAGLDAEGSTLAGSHSWPALLPGAIELPGGASARFLTARSELAQEGQAMQHCASGYWAKCFAGKSHIAALRGPAGERSTIEFAAAPDGSRSCHIVQHRALRNAEPCPALKACEAPLLRMALLHADFKALAQHGAKAEKVLAALGPSRRGADPGRAMLARDIYGAARMAAAARAAGLAS